MSVPFFNFLVEYILDIKELFFNIASYKPNLIVPPKFFSLPFIIFFLFAIPLVNPQQRYNYFQIH